MFTIFLHASVEHRLIIEIIEIIFFFTQNKFTNQLTHTFLFIKGETF